LWHNAEFFTKTGIILKSPVSKIISLWDKLHISVFLLMLYVVLAKTKPQHEGETSGEYPSYILF